MSDSPLSRSLEVEETLARLGGDRDLLWELYAAFAEDAPVKLESLVAAVEARDMSMVMKRAHSLKGSAAAVGALECRDLAIALESMAESNDFDAVKRLAHHLEEALDSVLKMIQQKL